MDTGETNIPKHIFTQSAAKSSDPACVAGVMRGQRTKVAKLHAKVPTFAACLKKTIEVIDMVARVWETSMAAQLGRKKATTMDNDVNSTSTVALVWKRTNRRSATDGGDTRGGEPCLFLVCDAWTAGSMCDALSMMNASSITTLKNRDEKEQNYDT